MNVFKTVYYKWYDRQHAAFHAEYEDLLQTKWDVYKWNTHPQSFHHDDVDWWCEERYNEMVDETFDNLTFFNKLILNWEV